MERWSRKRRMLWPIVAALLLVSAGASPLALVAQGQSREMTRSDDRQRDDATEISPDLLGDSGRIVGGVRVRRAYPFMVALLDTSRMGGVYQQQFCGGSLIDAAHVLTAAHCVATSRGAMAFKGTKLQSLDVRVGLKKLSTSGDRRDVIAVAIHPLYNPVTNRYDPAVLTLNRPITNLNPIALPGSGDVLPAAGTKLRVAGWGTLRENGASPEDLYRVDVPVTTARACQRANGLSPADYAVMFCAGYTQGGKDSCQGDSGGPIWRELGSGDRVQVGIVSFGEGCARRNKPGVYTRISNPAVRDFIAEQTSAKG